MEYTYDKWLRGADGVARVEVDAFGRPKQTVPVGGRCPRPATRCVPPSTASVQRAAEEALRTTASTWRTPTTSYAPTAAPPSCSTCKNGEVIAMASYPTFDPNVWVGGMQHEALQEAHHEDGNYPLLEPHHPGTKALGSTFKAVDSIAGLENGVITPSTTFDCPGYYTSPNDTLDKAKFQCWSPGRPRQRST